MLIFTQNIVLPPEVVLPLSKSESNRALMIHFYSEIQKNKNSKTQKLKNSKDKKLNNLETWRLGDSVTSLSTSDDTILLKNLLEKINIHNNGQSLLSANCCPLTLDCANAGTVFRFLMTAVAVQFTIYNEQFTIDEDCPQQLGDLVTQRLGVFLTGSDRMKQRPIDSLVDALRSLGVSIEYTEKEGFPPILIKSTIDTTDTTDLHRFIYTRDTRGPWRLEISAEQSSQFASSLLLVAPLFENGLELHLTGNISSLPYIDMTVNMMRQCGIDVVRNERDITIKSGIYNVDNITIEPDWSAAAFWYEIIALSDNSEVLLKNLNINSLQADAAAMKMFKELGVETIAVKDGIIVKKLTANSQQPIANSLSSKALVQQPTANSQQPTANSQQPIANSLSSKALVQQPIANSQQPTATFNFKDCPDLFPAVIATCAGLKLDSTFAGLKNLSIKESDRKKAMMNELRKINISFEDVSDDELKMFCPDELPYFTEGNPIFFNNYGDHRIAMALSILSTKIGAISMENTEVVSKSYPKFFEELIVNN